jgi:hypothetical protein
MFLSIDTFVFKANVAVPGERLLASKVKLTRFVDTKTTIYDYAEI